MVLNLFKLELHCQNHPLTSENTIFCRMVLVIESGFRCRVDASDSTLYCYSVPIAENHLNALENTKNS